jgi:hypothetical protein
MSTIKVTNVSHPSAASPAIVLDADGDATYSGVHDFSAATVTGAPQGLVKITSNTFNVTSTLSVNNCFTSSYKNYMVILSNCTTTGGTEWFFRLRVAGTDASGSNYYWQRLYATGTGTGAASNSSATSLQYSYLAAAAVRGDVIMYFMGPQTATATGWLMPLDNTGANILNICGGGHTLTTSYDGFSAYMAAGTISGTYTVYGLQS